MIPPEAGVALGDSCRLWSRWDMIKQDIWKFLRAGMKMKDFQTLFDLLDKSDNVSIRRYFSVLEKCISNCI